jgi:hypothetical protein
LSRRLCERAGREAEIRGSAALTLLAIGVILLAAGCAQPQLDLEARIFLIYDGPGAGVILETPPGTSRVTSTGPQSYPVNGIWPADGAITPADQWCDKPHYHGRLYGLPDVTNGRPWGPNGCGWGRVREKTERYSGELATASEAYVLEWLARSALLAGDYPTARRRIVEAVSLLRDLPKTMPEHTGTVQDIVDSDLDARDALNRLIDGKGRPNDAEDARDALAKALSLKQQLIPKIPLEPFERIGEFRVRMCTIIGTPGPDVLRGTSKRDVACGLGGADIMFGLGGPDLLLGGTGNDTVKAGDGNDTVRSGPGQDRVEGGRGNDVVDSGPDRDRVRGGPGRDTVDGKREKKR